jgi:hypothetical protein
MRGLSRLLLLPLLILPLTLSITMTTGGTEIRLQSLPGALFSIPLEFGPGHLSPGAPVWVKYEGGSLRGVAGGPGLYKFRLTEEEGGAEVRVEVGVRPPPPDPDTSNNNNSPCSAQKPFNRLLSLDEKLSLGTPGGLYLDGERGT